jgi:DNA-binding CsgD family transcriptional regulator
MSEAVRRRCRDHPGDERELRVALLEDLRAFVPFSFHVWLLIDPETEVGTAPLATVPDALVDRLPAAISARYATRLNRWDTMATAVESLDRATAGRRAESRMHREVLGPGGVGDVASICFRDPHGCWSFLDLWRRIDEPSFSERELAALADDAGPITQCLRECQARAFDTPMLPAIPPGPAVMFLAPDLRVIGQTPDTDEFLRALLPTEADRRPVPAGAYNVSAALIADEAGRFDHPPIARARAARGIWLTFAAARVDSERPRNERDIAVTISASSPGERQRLYVRAHGLSPREIDVVDRLAGGASTRAIAEALFVSEHTVQDHLKSIFDKTGARNRRTLLARINGR